MTDDRTELAARRAVVARYGTLPGYVPHCGFCGRPMATCDADRAHCARGDVPPAPMKDAPAPPAEEKPQTWRDRPPLL